MPEPANEIGVIYDVATGEVRGVVIPDHQHQLDDPAHVQAGEAMMRIPKDQIGQYSGRPQDFHAYVHKAAQYARGQIK